MANEISILYQYYKAPKDSLKLKAAHYLVTNMQGLYYYQGDQLVQYQQYLKLVNLDNSTGKYLMNTFQNDYGPFALSNLSKKSDLNAIKASMIIENIELAFKVWRDQPWNRKLKFDHFCEYILPYKLFDAPPSEDRRLLYDQYNPLLDSVRQVGGNATMACKVINDHLRNEHWLFTTRPDFMPHFSSRLLYRYRTGSCRDMADFAIYVMRAVGIPTAIDFLPQWPYRTQGHNWNVVFEKDKFTMFMGADDSPGTPHKPGTKKGKIYRNTYAINPQSLSILSHSDDTIPDILANSRMIDVTQSYVKTFTVRLNTNSIPPTNNRFVYLAVFNNKDWIPIAWAMRQHQKASFYNIEGGIVYLPCFYTTNRKILPAGYPFELSKTGDLDRLFPNCKSLNKKLIATRIFPIVPDKFEVTPFNGCFQLANRSDFKGAITYQLPEHVQPFMNRIKIDAIHKYRFVRFLTAPETKCRIGELAVYDENKHLKGQAIGSQAVSADNQIANATDGDYSTWFESKFTTGSWVGIDLHTRKKITKIFFSVPCIETLDTEIVNGNEYELFYWANAKGWKSLGTHAAASGSVVFNYTPTNALYLLYNHSRESDSPKRIFTFKNGRQIWY